MSVLFWIVVPAIVLTLFAAGLARHRSAVKARAAKAQRPAWKDMLRLAHAEGLMHFYGVGASDLTDDQVSFYLGLCRKREEKMRMRSRVASKSERAPRAEARDNELPAH